MDENIQNKPVITSKRVPIHIMGVDKEATSILVKAVRFGDLRTYMKAWMDDDEETLVALSCDPVPSLEKAPLEEIETLMAVIEEVNNSFFVSFVRRNSNRKLEVFRAINQAQENEAKALQKQILDRTLSDT